eukprot:COSAG02_NODE_634_length_19259_cov_9.871347_7_plen_428_part_00
MPRRSWRGSMPPVLVLLATLGSAHAQGASCAGNGDCHGHGTCGGISCSSTGTCGGKDPTCIGTCQGTCSCTGQWGGTACTEDPCTQNDDCGQHGTCKVSGNSHTCDCDDEWGGSTCTEDPCTHHDDCGQHGTCKVSGNSHTCDCDPGWEGGTCNQPKSCGLKDPPDPNSKWDGGSCNEVLDGTCTARCQSGYTGGNLDATFTCVADGSSMKYTGSLTCAAVTCPAPDPHDSTECATKMTYGSDSATCTAKCNDGWTGGPQFAKFECVPDGMESKGRLTGALDCQRVKCGDGNYPGYPQAHATTSGTSKSGHTECTDMYFEDSCTVKCEDCYSAGTKSVTFTCDHNGKDSQGKFDRAAFICDRKSSICDTHREQRCFSRRGLLTCCCCCCCRGDVSSSTRSTPEFSGRSPPSRVEWEKGMRRYLYHKM